MREARAVRRVPARDLAHPADVDQDAELLPVAAVARRLGVAAATLRTWDRRYGLGPSQHRPGSHRRYTSADLRKLQEMTRLLRAGWAPADAARAATTRPSPKRETAQVPTAPAGGGRVLALPDAGPAARGLGRSALALDGPGITQLVRTELAGRGLVPTWDEVLLPVLAAVGQRWAETGEGVEVEHLLAECLTQALQEWAADRPPAKPGRPVLLAGAPGERHALPLHAVAAGLAEQRVGWRVLGPDLPAEAVAAAVRRTGPSALFVWAQRRPTADAARALAVPEQRPPTGVVVGGPGWSAASVPAGAVLVTGLAEAIAEVAARAR